MFEAVLDAVYTDTTGDLRAYDALLRPFGIMDWVETALKKEIEVRHPKEDVGGLARNEKVRIRVWIEPYDCVHRSMGVLVNAGEEKLDLGTGGTGVSFSLGKERSVVFRSGIG